MCPITRTPPPILYAHHAVPVVLQPNAQESARPPAAPAVLPRPDSTPLRPPARTRGMAMEAAIRNTFHGVIGAFVAVFGIEDSQAFTRGYLRDTLCLLRRVNYFDRLATQLHRCMDPMVWRCLSSPSQRCLQTLLLLKIPNLAGQRIATQLLGEWPVPAMTSAAEGLRPLGMLAMWGPLMLVSDGEVDDALLATVAQGLTANDIDLLHDFAATPAGRAYLAGLPRVVAWSQAFIRELEGSNTL